MGVIDVTPPRPPSPAPRLYLQRQQQVYRVRLLRVARRQVRDEGRPLGLGALAENLGQPSVASFAAVLAAQLIARSWFKQQPAIQESNRCGHQRMS